MDRLHLGSVLMLAVTSLFVAFSCAQGLDQPDEDGSTANGGGGGQIITDGPNTSSGTPSSSSGTPSSSSAGPSTSSATTTSVASSTSMVASSSSGMGGLCDNTGDCQLCADCAFTSTCAAQNNACNASIDCLFYQLCIVNCMPNDLACFSACDQVYPVGSQIYYNLALCVVCTECYSDCNGAGSGCP